MNNGKTATFQITFHHQTFLLAVAVVKTEKFNTAARAQQLSLYNDFQITIRYHGAFL